MANPARKRVALYTRVSTEDQDATLQFGRLRDWAHRMDYEITNEFTETASGRRVNRPEQNKLMALVRGRHVHAIAVVKLDRFGRSLIDLRNSVDTMVDNGVTFFAIDQAIAYEKHSAIGKLSLNQLAAYAEFEADLISDRTKEALAAKVDRFNKTGEAWISKTGRTVSKLGHEFQPCWQCGGKRVDQTRGKRGGKVRMLCRGCKGLPSLPAKLVKAKVSYVETQPTEEQVEEGEEDEEEQV